MDPPSSTTTTASPFSTLTQTHFQFNPSLAPAPVSVEKAQWAQQETVELISIRGELEEEFAGSKRNKALWEIVSCKMREKGFVRTSFQCKCKWKNLLNRYKSQETAGPGNGRQCQFFEELHAVFSEQVKNFQQSSMESQPVVVQSRKVRKSNISDQYSGDFSQDEDDGLAVSNGESLLLSSDSRKRKAATETHKQATGRTKSSEQISASSVQIRGSSSILEMLKAFFQQQQMLEMQGRESLARHQRQRDMFEQECRGLMEGLERERLMLEEEWREKEEQRKMTEELRAEKRDVLLTTLLNKLINEDQV